MEEESIFEKKIKIGNQLATSISSSEYLGYSMTGTSPSGATYKHTAGLSTSNTRPQFASTSNFIKNDLPFEYLDSLEKAELVKKFLISRGVERINEETAKALFLISTVLTKKENVIKQPKKKLKF